jgi:hypothetical protein
MKIILYGVLRTLVVAAVVALITTLIYFISGGTGSRGLSDALVVASFATLVVGTFLGIGKLGYKGEFYPDDDWLPRMLREFFRAGPFPVSLVAGAVVCFLLAILVDGLF